MSKKMTRVAVALLLLVTFTAGAAPAALVEALRDDVLRFAAGTPPADDLTLLALAWAGPVSGR